MQVSQSPTPERAVLPIRGEKPLTDCFESQIFIRHQRQLRALMLDSQAWFCLQDTARLMGRPLDERATLKLDPDQSRCLAQCKWPMEQATAYQRIGPVRDAGPSLRSRESGTKTLAYA
jgi:hypothetical protein